MIPDPHETGAAWCPVCFGPCTYRPAARAELPPDRYRLPDDCTCPRDVEYVEGTPVGWRWEPDPLCPHHGDAAEEVRREERARFDPRTEGSLDDSPDEEGRR